MTPVRHFSHGSFGACRRAASSPLPCSPIPPVPSCASTYEPEEAGDLIHSQVELFDCSVLEEKAAEMRKALRAKGWLELQLEGAGVQ